MKKKDKIKHVWRAGHWPDCEINNGGECDCGRNYMTNMTKKKPLTIESIEREFDRKFVITEQLKSLSSKHMKSLRILI